MARNSAVSGSSRDLYSTDGTAHHRDIAVLNHRSGQRALDPSSRARSCFHCALRRSCFPGRLNDDIVREINRVAHGRGPATRGETIFNTGDPFRCVYTVRSGALRTSMVDRSGAEQVIGFTLPGEIAGIESIGRNAHCTQAVALQRTTVCAIPLDGLLGVAQSHPGLQRRFQRITGDMIRRNHTHFRELGRHTAHQRLLLFLADLLERYRAAGFATDEVHLPMYREDIANYLGVALETISRMMTRLADEGVIEVRHRHIRIIEAGITARTDAGEPRDAAVHGQ
jgi:CRP/FNR family transcriptional regulator